MNIAQAKEEIKNSIMAYLMKDAFGKYKIAPIHTKTDFTNGSSGYRKNSDYGADCHGMPDWTCGIHYYTSYKTECDWSAIYLQRKITAATHTV